MSGERSDGQVAHALWIVFGGSVLIALPVIESIVRRHTFEELVTGEKFRVERSMKARRLYAGIALAVYAVACVLALL